VAQILERHGYRVTQAHSVAEAAALLRARYFPVVVSDLYLGSETGMPLIELTKTGEQPSFLIFLTGQGSIGTTVQAIHQGAFAYLSKPADFEALESTLLPVIHRAVKQIQALTAQTGPRAVEATAQGRVLIGKTQAMIDVFHAVAKASLSRGNVIILGESGSGKELVARAIHENSQWAGKPFVSINCSALTETLLESELFGHVKGSFTGAISHKRGLFEEADGGTLFLDEIGDISPLLQVKLLRAIQEGEIRPVGASENSKVDVRVIAATHRDLGKLVAKRTFREDLFYRLKVFLIHVPPLRDRLEDLPELVQYLLSRAAAKTHRSITRVSEETMAVLSRYDWPGNIRELENAIDRAVAMAHTDILFPEDFPREIASLADTEAPLSSDEGSAQGTAADHSLGSLESAHILRTLQSVAYNKSKAADLLGIDRGTLYRKALKYSIPLERPSEKS
jgi:DNA-binding NtrC family response regulator